MMRSLFEAPAISVGELCRRIRQALWQQFPATVRVVGEVSKCSVVDGNVYFTLKDTYGLIACICLRAQAETLRVQLPLPDGLAVEVDARVEIYDRKSQYQLRIEGIVPVGKGALYLELEQLKIRLEREGLFADERKRPIPAFIRHVAIVTSEQAAVLEDFKTTCYRRGAHVRITPVHSPVQGATAAPALARAIRTAGNLAVDVVVVARGGGSPEDLWAFNTELVARAIATCQRPVITAVGHKKDTTIADLVADKSVATATAAAELVAREREALLEHIAACEVRLHRSLTRGVDAVHSQLALLLRRVRRSGPSLLAARVQRIDDLAGGIERCDPRRRITQWRERTQRAAQRLRTTQLRSLEEKRGLLRAAQRDVVALLERDTAQRANRLQVIQTSLSALGPQQTLQRGYAIVYDRQGSIISDVAQTRRGDPIEVEMHSGWLSAEVRATRERHEENDTKD